MSQYFGLRKNGKWTYLDVYSSGQAKSNTAIILLNGVGQLACMWPPTLMSTLEKAFSVVTVDFRGLHTPEYAPNIADLLKDVRRVRRTLGHRRVFVLGYSVGCIVTQLIMSWPPLADQFAGFVLVATACELKPDVFARTYVRPAGGTPAPLGDTNIAKSVFGHRLVPAGETASFIDGPPEAWTVVSKPDGGPQRDDWTEPEAAYLRRKIAWLFPPTIRRSVYFNHELRVFLSCPSSPEHYSRNYVNFASTLFADQEGHPGRGLLYKVLADTRPQANQVRKVLIVYGSQDSIFPVEHFVSLVEHVSKLYPNTQSILYCNPTERDPPEAAHLQNLDRTRIEAAGHALLFQDKIVRDLVNKLVRWLLP